MTTVSRQNNRLAIASFVFGILGLTFLVGPLWAGLSDVICLLSPLTSILAIIYGHTSKSRIKKNPDSVKGDGFALAGLIIGYIGIILIGLWVAGAIPSFTTPRELARRAACKSNLRCIQLGSEMYAEVNSGAYPPDIMTLKKFLVGTGDMTNMNRLFSCPSTGNKDGNDYAMAPDLKDGDPKTKDAFWDTSIDNHGKKGRNVITLDGTITFRKP